MVLFVGLENSGNSEVELGSLANAQTWSSGALTPGNYMITELVPLGWDLTNIIILNDSANSAHIDLSAGTVFISLSVGENINIVYQNTQQLSQVASFSVVKVVCSVDSLVRFVFVSSAVGGSFSLAGGEVWSSGFLVPGRYVLTEVLQPGWVVVDVIVAGSSDCFVDVVTGTVVVDLQAGDHVTVVYQNV